MKVLKSIEKALAKRPGYTATVRQDTIRRAIERDEYDHIRCAYRYTDDYAWDSANDYGRNDNVSKEAMLREYSILSPSCWVEPHPKKVNDKYCYRVSIMFHSNLAYDMYVPYEDVTKSAKTV